MAPTLRSAPSTPVGKSKEITSSSRASSSTPRKVPRCSKCQRPRAGHPRSGCPFSDSPLQNSRESSPTPHGEDKLSDALGSLVITPPTNEATKAPKRSLRRASAPILGDSTVLPNQSVLSLRTNSLVLVDKIMEPDGTTSEGEQEVKEALKKKVVRWQDAIQTPAQPPRSILKNGLNYRPLRRQLMPGTLIPPTPESSFASLQDHPNNECKAESPQPCALTSSLTGASSPGPVAQPTSSPPPDEDRNPGRARAEPLARSMSMEQRDAFMSTLDRTSTAMVYVLPKADIPTITADASKLGFFIRVAMNPDDSKDANGLLVIGRGEEAVIKLFEQIANRASVEFGASSAKSPRASIIGGGSAFRMAAGGALVGAVGAFIGLAIS